MHRVGLLGAGREVVVAVEHALVKGLVLVRGGLATGRSCFGPGTADSGRIVVVICLGDAAVFPILGAHFQRRVGLLLRSRQYPPICRHPGRGPPR